MTDHDSRRIRRRRPCGSYARYYSAPVKRQDALLAIVLLSCTLACGGTTPLAPQNGGDTSPTAPPVLAPEDALATPALGAHAAALADAFDADRAMATVRYVDRYFRVRGNEGYQKTLEHVRTELRAAGFGDRTVQTLELGPMLPTWTPRSARLELLAPDPVVLHDIPDEQAPDRTALLVGSSATAEAVFPVRRPGSTDPYEGYVVLAPEGGLRSAFEEAVVRRGAAGVLVKMVEGYHQADEHPEVVQFGYLPEHERAAFGFSVSPASWQRLEAALTAGPASVRVAIDVSVDESRASAVELTLPGTNADAPPVVFFAHVDEPGAHDNASGVAALLELARALRAATESGAVPVLARPVVFLWGQEIECSRLWLHGHEGPVTAGLVFDMVGGDPAVVGAPFLIERMPDPGAVWTRAPDEHTEWGAGDVSEDELRGHLLNDYAAAATAAVQQSQGPWRARTNPFEGGSDHVSFLRSGFPAVLAWHFTDDAYHTNRDRADRVSGEEIRRVAASMGAIAVGLASDREVDRREMLAAVAHAAQTRLVHVWRAALTQGPRDVDLERRVAAAWVRWYDQALASVAEDIDLPGLADEVTAARAANTSRGATLDEAITRLQAGP